MGGRAIHQWTLYVAPTHTVPGIGLAGAAHCCIMVRCSAVLMCLCNVSYNEYCAWVWQDHRCNKRSNKIFLTKFISTFVADVSKRWITEGWIILNGVIGWYYWYRRVRLHRHGWHHSIDRPSRPLTKNIGTESFTVIIAVSIKIEHIEPWNV